MFAISSITYLMNIAVFSGVFLNAGSYNGSGSVTPFLGKQLGKINCKKKLLFPKEKSKEYLVASHDTKGSDFDINEVHCILTLHIYNIYYH